MQDTKFTSEERLLASRLMKENDSRFQAFFAYAVYIFPSFAFAIYGLYKKDFGAVVVSYFALFVVAILYLSHANKISVVLKSLIRKYETEIRHLESFTTIEE